MKELVIFDLDGTLAVSKSSLDDDAWFPGGNDYPAKEAGVVFIRVRDPDESKRVIEAILACVRDENR